METQEKFQWSHRKLLVWQASIALARETYKLTRKFPSEEKFGLSLQMRRAAVSVASNIAEGAGRSSNAEKTHFFVIAQGSLSELDTQLEIVKGLDFTLDGLLESQEKRIHEVSRLLSGLIRSRREKG